jgi:hypothetical protein
MPDPALPAGGLDKDPPHRLSRSGEEMATVVPPGGIGRTDEPEACLMDKGCPIQRVSRRLDRHPRRRQLSEFVVDDGEEFGRGLLVTRSRGVEEAGDVGHAAKCNGNYPHLI